MSNEQQPEALRLAKRIEESGQFTNLLELDAAAAELRRLQAENEVLKAQRDRLAEHARVLRRALEKVDDHPQSTYLIHRIVKRAIASVKDAA